MMMKHLKDISGKFAVATAAAFIALFLCGDITAAAKKDGKPRMSLKKENAALKTEIDSLKAEIERYRMELSRTDSMVYEMIDFYEGGKEESVDTCITEYTAEVSDSLLNIWYAHRLINEEDMDGVDMDSVKFQSNVPDSVYIERIAKMNSFITLPYNDIVNILLYSSSLCRCKEG